MILYFSITSGQIEGTLLLILVVSIVTPLLHRFHLRQAMAFQISFFGCLTFYVLMAQKLSKIKPVIPCRFKTNFYLLNLLVLCRLHFVDTSLFCLLLTIRVSNDSLAEVSLFVEFNLPVIYTLNDTGS